MANQKYQRIVTPKKSLGQHFLRDDSVSMDIADAIEDNGCPVLEIGPGTGALTKHLLPKFPQLSVVEIDLRSIAYLKQHYPSLTIYAEDFLQMNIAEKFPKGVNIVGNFPYHISSQIIFKVLENASFVPLFCGMFQKEVAQRVCASPKSKAYGQLTLLREMEYEAEYLFDVQKEAFDPPPKVMSGVLRMHRVEADVDGVPKKALRQMIKQAFSQRRKKMRNSLASYFTTDQLSSSVFDQRPEELVLLDFVKLAKQSSFISNSDSSNNS